MIDFFAQFGIYALVTALIIIGIVACKNLAVAEKEKSARFATQGKRSVPSVHPVASNDLAHHSSGHAAMENSTFGGSYLGAVDVSGATTGSDAQSACWVHLSEGGYVGLARIHLPEQQALVDLKTGDVVEIQSSGVMTRSMPPVLMATGIQKKATGRGFLSPVSYHEGMYYQAVPRVVLLDVRSVEEYAEGHAEGAVNLPLHLLKACLTETGRLKDYDQQQPILVYCRSGIRSNAAAEALAAAGYTVFDLGGYPEA